ncbi:Nitrogen permease regulator 3 protein [Fasciolopsis buskii]|uniref:GATOR complex protein NPRL3 n=1 Tax=Fasciolopsis buskii TaxID=27845 RepID=A0A8E0S5M9_9TREM|nr:Nitrogen permease regulator 3 protein [Fasciolopsis buski]
MKLDNHIFIGALFNVTGGPNEVTGLDSDTESYASSTSRVGHSLISFGIVFAMDASAPPSVLSHYAELARLTGTQIRRAELVFHYLSNQRNIIISTVDRTSPGLGYGEDLGFSNNPIKSDTDSSRLDPDCQQRLFRSSSSRRSHRSCCGGLPNSNIPGGPSSLVRPSAISSPDKTSADHSADRSPRHSDFPMETTLDQLARLSSLCAELKHILDSLCQTGHVAVMIHNLYPVYFCLPHLAYTLTREPSQLLIPAIRPAAVWRAMDRIRPYHALILLPRKEELINQHIPPDINATMFDFVNDLSPTLSLHNMSVRMHSQLHCLSLALWLIYRGHALIVYPIVANNTYVLSPHVNAWFGPQLIGQFAGMFPTVNLAALLASFSTGLTLKDYISTDPNNSRVNGSVSTANPTKSEDIDEAEHLWANLSYTHKVELISWLLRRRLIIQIHIYVFSTLLTLNDSVTEKKLTNSTKSKCTCTVENTHPTTGASQHGCFEELDKINFQLDQIVPQSVSSSVPEDLVRELCQLFPESSRVKHVQTILLHPGATQNLTLLRLFCRILPRLPAHLEELMFVESVDRITLVDCVERFNPILCTARLPDPVTACFAGIDWPE